MRVNLSGGIDQALLSILVSLLLVFLLPGCSRSAGELPVIPPPTHPLVRDYIGYGVVTVSFTHLLSEPGLSGISIGYLRQGTVVRIIERRAVTSKGKTASWVLAEGNYEGTGAPSQGWLEETTVAVYENESMAQTASKAMSL